MTEWGIRPDQSRASAHAIDCVKRSIEIGPLRFKLSEAAAVVEKASYRRYPMALMGARFIKEGAHSLLVVQAESRK